MTHPFTIAGERRRAKYGNKPTEVDGVRFASKREAGRYSDLKIMERANLIRSLRRQVPFPLDVNGIPICRYVADFVYVRTADNAQIVEDSKGFRTPEYKLKRALMKAIHGLEIVET